MQRGKERDGMSVIPRTLRQIAYLVGSLPLAVVAAVVVATLVAMGIVLSPIVGGLVIVVAAAAVAGRFAVLERSMQRVLLGKELLAPLRTSNLGTLDKLRERQTWLDITWAILRCMVSALTTAVTVAWLGLALAVVITPLEIFLPALYPEHWFKFGNWQPSNPTHWGIQLTIGLAALLLTPRVAEALSGIQARLGEVLLSGESELVAKVESLTTSRDAARRAEADQLRRLEQDLHDGPQQRLVRLNMDLARAERALAADPNKATSILQASRTNATETLHELRNLSRRVAPPVLVDRGLRAAVRELASQSLVPVDAEVPDERFPTHAEQAAYYVVSEALANVNKHARASSVEIRAIHVEGALQLEITDDGVGGADASKGHGLAGLRQRVSAVEGELEVHSPAGGPTIVRALIPCESLSPTTPSFSAKD